MIEEEHELDRVAQRAQQEARERAEAEKAGQRATGRVGWGDLRGDLGKRSSGEEAAEERPTSGRSSGDEVKAPRRRVGRGAMTASLMKKRQSKAESADYNPNPNPNPNPNAHKVPEFVYDLSMSYFDMLVPTVNTVRCSFLIGPPTLTNP